MSVIREVPSVNFHLWEPCNMRCGFCFAGFPDVKRDVLPKGHLNKEDCTRVVELLADAAFEKINFAGGEPTLCPWLPHLIRTGKCRGMTTSIVTNGSRFSAGWLDSLDGGLDWIAFSIDSTDARILKRTGRELIDGPLSEQHYLGIARMVKERGIGLKVNTVVTNVNWQEDLSSFILAARPARWKILQVLPVVGQNDGNIERYAVTNTQFEAYVARNQRVEHRDNGGARGQ